jgi:DNA-binding MarR family transcriptional regulator
VADPIGEIQRALLQLSRNNRMQSAKSSVGGSFVAGAILSYVDSAADPTATDLAELWALDKSTVSRQLGELEERGMLVRVAHPTRSRTQLLKLTAKGKKALEVALGDHRKRIEKVLATWNDDDIARFGELLGRFVY